METIKALCNYFHDMHNGFTAYVDEIESYDGYWVVYINDEEYEIATRYVFESAEEFKAWTDGVVLC